MYGEFDVKSQQDQTCINLAYSKLIELWLAAVKREMEMHSFNFVQDEEATCFYSFVWTCLKVYFFMENSKKEKKEKERTTKTLQLT